MTDATKSGPATTGVPAAPSATGSRRVPGTDLPLTWHWWVPALAMLMVLGFAGSAWWQAGPAITVRFAEGHGIKPGDPVKYRGIVVGELRDVALTPHLDGVVVHAVLRPEAADLARADSRFWIVRPQVGLYGVQGLDTVIGNRYLTVQPGTGSRASTFVGLDDGPARTVVAAGSLEIVLIGGRRGSVRPGTPLLYRQVPIGAVQSVVLSSDAVGVEVRAVVDAPYIKLVRDNSRFWNAGGVDINLGLLRGLNVDVESLQTLMAGGIAMATPDDAGALAAPGHRFALADKVDPDWLAWAPALHVDKGAAVAAGVPSAPIGGDLPTGAAPTGAVQTGAAPAGAASLPKPVRVRVTRPVKVLGGLWHSRRETDGWGIVLERGLLVPLDMVPARDDPRHEADDQVSMTVGGQPCSRQAGAMAIRLASAGLALVPAGFIGSATLPVALADARWRRPIAPEDVAVQTPLDHTPLPLDAARLTPQRGLWLVDAVVRIPAGHHGAPVFATRDGRLVGALLELADGRFGIAPLPDLAALH